MTMNETLAAIFSKINDLEAEEDIYIQLINEENDTSKKEILKKELKTNRLRQTKTQKELESLHLFLEGGDMSER